jgi:hypothetical protein
MDDAGNAKIWRYMDFAKFASILSSEALYFACPSDFADPYEGYYPKSYVAAMSALAQAPFDQLVVTRNQMAERFPGIDVGPIDTAIFTAKDRIRKGISEIRLKFGVNCWHKNEHESEAMWKLYAASGQGIAVESTAIQLRDAIQDKVGLHIGDVHYADFATAPIEKNLVNYGLFFKRKSFEHEKELRATLPLKVPGKGIPMKCDLDVLVTKIHISPFAPPFFRDAVADLCSGNAWKLSKPVVRSTLFDAPDGDYHMHFADVPP